MNRIRASLIAGVVCTASILSTSAVLASGAEWLRLAVQNNELRSAEELARDVNRKPIETLTFYGLKPDMRVVELFPGGGWYTRILQAALRENGEYSKSTPCTQRLRSGLL